MRKVLKINDGWWFAKNAAVPADRSGITEDFQAVTLPHCYNGLDGQDGGCDYFRGRTVYARMLSCPERAETDRLFLSFEGVNSVSEVYVDGELLYTHRGGYSGFRVDLTEAARGRRELCLAVCADNRNHRDVYPQMADFTFYGGIYRNVSLLCVPGSHFALEHYGDEGMLVHSQLSGDNAVLSARIFLQECREGDLVEVSVLSGGAEKEAGRVCAEAVVPARSECLAELMLWDPVRWQGRENPYLYTVRARLLRHNEVLDEIQVPHGIREFQVDPERGFLLNGVPVPLRGVSRHQDRLEIGNALTEAQHLEDAEEIAALGANTVRLAHYQHSQSFYDACDRLGLVVWAEIPFISVMSRDPAAHENAREQLKELIFQNYNHPSICFWGISNEITIGGEKEGMQENLMDLHALVKELDGSRISTMAQLSMLPKDSAQNQITDVLGYNLYFGWYSGEMEDNERWLDDFHRRYPDRPLGLSEYGCEGIVSWHSDNPACRDYSEEYQALYHEHMAALIEARPYLWSTYVWNMFDFGCDGRDEGGVSGRNNKGLVTLDRRIRKDAYYVYKAYWSEEPFVHIAGRRYGERTGEKVEIKVYSNLPEVFLFVNGGEPVKLTGSRVFVFREVALEQGFNFLRAAGENAAADCITLKRVEAPGISYRMPEEQEENSGRNWFEGMDLETEAPVRTFREGFYSIRDLVGEILENEQAGDILVDALNMFGTMKVKKNLLGVMAGLPLEEMGGMLSQDQASSERLFSWLNAELQKVPKPQRTNQ